MVFRHAQYVYHIRGGGSSKIFIRGCLKYTFSISTISIPKKARYCDPLASLYQIAEKTPNLQQIGRFLAQIFPKFTQCCNLGVLGLERKMTKKHLLAFEHHRIPSTSEYPPVPYQCIYFHCKTELYLIRFAPSGTTSLT